MPSALSPVKKAPQTLPATSSPHPILDGLISKGYVRWSQKDDGYIGRAAFSDWVFIGNDKDSTERYLKHYPSPDMW